MGMKGHPAAERGGGGGGWTKMAMLAVVILVAVMGVIKVRDRRLFNLAIKDKDRQIISLHLLLQKERQYAKETKRKNQDLNAKLYSLRTQNKDLNNKIMVMQSTIGSIKDEQRALEIAIQDKQNEILLKDSQIKDFLTTTNTSSWFGLTSNAKIDEHTAGDLTLNHKAQVRKENGNDLGIYGRRSANESQTDAPSDKRRLKEKREDVATEVPQSKSTNYSTEAFLDRKDEDEAEDTISSTESSNGSEADQGRNTRLGYHILY